MLLTLAYLYLAKAIKHCNCVTKRKEVIVTKGPAPYGSVPADSQAATAPPWSDEAVQPQPTHNSEDLNTLVNSGHEP